MWKDFAMKKKNLELLGKYELSKEDRQVLKNIIEYNVPIFGDDPRRAALHDLLARHAQSEMGLSKQGSIINDVLFLCEYADTKYILSYLEFLIIEVHNRSDDSDFRTERVREFLEKIKTFFDSRGLLYVLHPNQMEERLEIAEVASELMREQHSKVTLRLSEIGWVAEFNLISDAMSHFKKGPGEYAGSLKKLYSAIEMSLKHFVIETNESLSKDLGSKTVSQVLDVIRTNSLLSGIDRDIVSTLIALIEKLSALIGGKRKEGEHSNPITKEEVLFCVYNADNIISYLASKIRNKN
ncbi:hypothetical protein HZB02_03310 [Candidatus Woesearchaeota archaeon]|nr:hypothetical protein [Candidatus Woesearchaeota archaeon]